MKRVSISNIKVNIIFHVLNLFVCKIISDIFKNDAIHIDFRILNGFILNKLVSTYFYIFLSWVEYKVKLTFKFS